MKLIRFYFLAGVVVLLSACATPKQPLDIQPTTRVGFISAGLEDVFLQRMSNTLKPIYEIDNIERLALNDYYAKAVADQLSDQMVLIPLSPYAKNTVFSEVTFLKANRNYLYSLGSYHHLRDLPFPYYLKRPTPEGLPHSLVATTHIPNLVRLILDNRLDYLIVSQIPLNTRTDATRITVPIQYSEPLIGSNSLQFNSLNNIYYIKNKVFSSETLNWNSKFIKIPKNIEVWPDKTKVSISPEADTFINTEAKKWINEISVKLKDDIQKMSSVVPSN